MSDTFHPVIEFGKCPLHLLTEENHMHGGIWSWSTRHDGTTVITIIKDKEKQGPAGIDQDIWVVPNCIAFIVRITAENAVKDWKLKMRSLIGAAHE